MLEFLITPSYKLQLILNFTLNFSTFSISHSRKHARINSISVDMKERKLTLIGDMDLMKVVSKLRKTYRTEVVSVGPAKEPKRPKKEPEVVTPIVNGYVACNPYYPIYYCYY
ncbi:Heavy metal-associated isoprenylated plant protein 39 [Bienertia sinuspersici]